MSRKKNTLKAQKTSPGVWLILVVLFALLLAAYWNSFQAPLVFDDLLTIQRNTGVRFGELNWNLLSARSVLYLTFTLNYIWSGQEVWSYHLVNVLLHFLNGALIFFLALVIFRRVDADEQHCRLLALFAAAFFLVHPVQTESVTYISSRSELLSTVFYLSALLLFVKWPHQSIGFGLSCLVGVPFFFGLGAKETVISLPATIFLYDFIFLSGGQFRPMFQRWRFYITFFVGGIAATYYIATVALRGSIGSGLQGHLSSWHYFLTQLRVIVRYIYLVFFPVGLNLDYDFTASTSLWELAVIGSLLLNIAVLVVGWRLRKRAPIFAFSIFWFYLTLAPTSSVVPILDVIFEHRLYLPMAGVCLSFPLLLQMIQRRANNWILVRWSVRTYACALIALLTSATIMRNNIWADDVRLFEDVVSKSPGKERAYTALAWVHYKRAEYNPAIEVLQKGAEFLPDKGFGFVDTLGNLYLKTGRYDDAIKVFGQAIAMAKDSERLAISYNNLGVSYLYKWNKLQSEKAGMSDELFALKREEILKPAAEAFSRCLDIDPDMFGALDAFVNVSYYRGMHETVEAKAKERLKDKDDFNSLYTLGKLGFLRNDYAAAVQYFERAEKVRSDTKLLYFNHGYAFEQLGQQDRAIEKYTQAIRLDPIFIEAHHNVARLYMIKGEYSQATDHFAEVLRQDPKHVSTNLNLSRIYMVQGNTILARRHLSTVLEASPNNEQALTMLHQLGS